MSPTGAKLADIDYDSFGNVTSLLKPEDIDLVFGYTGQQRDKETGLSYYDQRYYDPGTGRFLSEDPGQEKDRKRCQEPFIE